MTSLGVHGSPGAWQQAGYVLDSVVTQLTEQLHAADAIGGSGLGSAWQGPVADSYLATWKAHHGHYGDLIYQISRGSGALIDFSERLADFQVRAARLESHWLGTGLHLTADGLQFTVPHGYASLAQDVLATLRGFEAEAVSDVTAMWRDIAGAVADLVTILESVIDAIADFDALAYTGVSAALGWAFQATVDDFRQEPWGPAGDLMSTEIRAIEVRAKHNSAVAEELAAKWSKDADADARAAAVSVVKDAEDDVKSADDLHGLKDVGGGVLTAVTVAFTVAETAKTARKVGWINSIEDHSGDLASAAAGIGLSAAADALMGTAVMAGAVAAAPILVSVGVVVAGGLICAGIGMGVKYEVDQHRAGTTRGLTDIGHAVTDAAVWGGDQTGLIPQPAS